MTDTKKLLKSKDVAEQLGITTRTLFRWDEEGSFKARRLPNGRKYYLQGDVDGLINGEAFESSVPVMTVGGGGDDTGLPNFHIASVCETGLECFYKACENYHDKLAVEKPFDFIARMENTLDIVIHAEDYEVETVKEAIHLIEKAWKAYT